MTDGDSLTRFAQRYRREAAAVLVQIAKDEDAPASARAGAAERILAYSDGRPGASRPITTEDIDTFDDDQCERLFRALLRRFELRTPGFWAGLTQQMLDYARAQEAILPKPNRFQRGDRQKLIAQPELSGRSSVPSLKVAAAAMQARTARDAHREHAQPSLEPIEVEPPPGIPLNPLLGDPDATPVPAGGVHPSVLIRSSSRNPLAMDSRFYNGYPWRTR
jgi:hypothetical protein